MAFIDYYKILGVKKDIPQKDVKRAYLKRAKQFHPDLHPDDPKAKAKFQAVNEAYQVIGDPDKRAKYDQYGEHWKEASDFGGGGQGSYSYGGGGSPFEGFDFSGFGHGGGGFSSFFEQLFGGSRGRRGQQFTDFGYGAQPDNADIEATVSIDLYKALLGGDVIIQLSNGTKLKLKIKPETQPGTRVRVAGKGRIRPNGTAGDLYITYKVTLPTNLTDRQRELLQQMRDAR